MPSTQTRRGFTLIELLVVCAIVAVAASLLFPVVAKARARAQQTKCLSNMRQMLLATQLYQQNHDQHLPDRNTVWQDLSLPPKLLECPAANGGNGYAYNYWVSQRVMTDPLMPKPNVLPLFTDSAQDENQLLTVQDIDPRHGEKASIGYADGHVASQEQNDVMIMPILENELLGESVLQWASGNYKSLCSLNLGSYWNGLKQTPPPSWESPAFTDARHYGGSPGGVLMFTDAAITIHGKPYPYWNTYTGNPAEMYVRIPISSNKNTISANGMWALSIPYYRYWYTGASMDVLSPANAPSIRGYANVSVLDNNKAPIATFKLNCSGTSAEYKLNDAGIQTVDNVAVLNGAWTYENKYKYAYDLVPHTLVLLGYGSGDVLASFSTSVDGLGGGVRAEKLAGDVTKPSWVELRVSCWQPGAPGDGGIWVYSQPYGGGINWGTAEP